MIGLLVLAILGFPLTVFSSECSQQQVSNVDCGQLLIPRYGLTATTDGQWVYVYGGAPNGGRNGSDFMHGGLVAVIERVDPVSLKSEYFSGGLYRRANHASVLGNGRLTSCGGRTQVGLERPRLATCEYVDLESRIFRELPQLPEPLRTLGMTEVNGSLYAAGGVTSAGEYSSVALRLAADGSTWDHLADLPFPRQGALLAVGQKIYALGGYNGSALKSVLMFDPNIGEWQRLKDLPYGLSAYSVVSDGSAIYIFGDYERMSSIHRYELDTGDFYLLDQQMTPRRHTGAVLVNDRALVIGGNQTSAGHSLTLIEAFELQELRTGGRRITADTAQGEG